MLAKRCVRAARSLLGLGWKGPPEASAAVTGGCFIVGITWRYFIASICRRSGSITN